MGAMASQITSLTIVYSTIYSGANQRIHQSSASLAFVRGIHRWPVNSPHKWLVTRKMFPFDDVIMMICTAMYIECACADGQESYFWYEYALMGGGGWGLDGGVGDVGMGGGGGGWGWGCGGGVGVGVWGGGGGGGVGVGGGGGGGGGGGCYQRLVLSLFRVGTSLVLGNVCRIFWIAFILDWCHHN